MYEKKTVSIHFFKLHPIYNPLRLLFRKKR